MSRITLTCCFAALLGACTSLSANRIDWEHARLACADVGIDPGSSAFGTCVSNLYYSLYQEQSMGER
jgi:hypothetical protein